MRIGDGMHVEWVEGEAVVLDSSNGALHYLNPTAALVFAEIEEHGYDKALEDLRGRFSDVPEFEQELGQLLHQFQEQGLLVDD